ncbi:MAG: hypothetical protein CBB97_25555 [Candidatus Endolissoclinum sp. TMED37]|nr:MAG: hypothetical protein CBB97_25555 [Candidatus Endolissoclinum sp. TMED37]
MELEKNELTKYILPYKQNHNWGLKNKNYHKKFASKEILYYLPEILKYNHNRYTHITPKILDLGCGAGPMAFAHKLTFEPETKKEIDFVGIDINQQAIDFLKKAYPKNYYFHLHQGNDNINYIGKNLKGDNNNTLSHSDGNECDFKIGFEFKSDIQWSSSFFTHLTPNGCDKSLNFIKNNLSQDGYSFNSWLLIDPLSKASLKIGASDRKLNYDYGEYMSYSKENPLVCSAYKIDFVEKIYDKNELEIVSILRGSWRGGEKNTFNHYQDIIVSKLK